MSFYTYIASEFPLENVENKRIKKISVNEALEMGVSVSDLVLNSTTIDRDEPGVLLWVEKEEDFDEISIRAVEKSLWVNGPPVPFDYCAILSWRYSKERAKQLIAYIKRHLEISDRIEIWGKWDGSTDLELRFSQYTFSINDLSLADIEKIFTSNGIGEYRITITGE